MFQFLKKKTSTKDDVPLPPPSLAKKEIPVDITSIRAPPDLQQPSRGSSQVFVPQQPPPHDFIEISLPPELHTNPQYITRSESTPQPLPPHITIEPVQQQIKSVPAEKEDIFKPMDITIAPSKKENQSASPLQTQPPQPRLPTANMHYADSTSADSTIAPSAPSTIAPSSSSGPAWVTLQSLPQQSETLPKAQEQTPIASTPAVTVVNIPAAKPIEKTAPVLEGDNIKEPGWLDLSVVKQQGKQEQQEQQINKQGMIVVQAKQDTPNNQDRQERQEKKPAADDFSDLPDFDIPDFENPEEETLPSFEKPKENKPHQPLFVRAFDYIRLMKEKKQIQLLVGTAYSRGDEFHRLYDQEKTILDQWYDHLNACQEQLVEIDQRIFDKVKA
jgi:hypothetical protein